MDWWHIFDAARLNIPALKGVVSVGGGLIGASSGAWHFWTDRQKKRETELRRLVIKIGRPDPPLTNVTFIYEAPEVHEGLRIAIEIRSPPDLNVISEEDAYVDSDGAGNRSLRPDIVTAGAKTLSGRMRFTHQYTQTRTIKSDHPEFSAKFLHPSADWVGEVVVTITSGSTGKRLLRRIAKISPTT